MTRRARPLGLCPRRLCLPVRDRLTLRRFCLLRGGRSNAASTSGRRCRGFCVMRCCCLARRACSSGIGAIRRPAPTPHTRPWETQVTPREAFMGHPGNPKGLPMEYLRDSKCGIPRGPQRPWRPVGFPGIPRAPFGSHIEYPQVLHRHPGTPGTPQCIPHPPPPTSDHQGPSPGTRKNPQRPSHTIPHCGGGPGPSLGCNPRGLGGNPFGCPRDWRGSGEPPRGTDGAFPV